MSVLRRIAPPLLLFFLAPLVAEYLLGDLPTTNLAALPVLALMYGSGALLVRETVRRIGGGWASFFLLALAYGLIEEGLVDQSLFNPTYLHLRLLDYGFIPALGVSLPWTVYVLGLHVLWSLATPIGLAEALFPTRRRQPWLSRGWLIAIGLMFVAGMAMGAAFSLRQAQHFASPAQIAVSLALIVALIAAALALGRRPAAVTAPVRAAPPVALTLVVCLGLGSLHLLIYAHGGLGLHWPWPVAAAAMLLNDAALAAWFAFASRGRTWRALDGWAAAQGGLLVYAWFGYEGLRNMHHEADLVGHSVLVAALLALGLLAGLRARLGDRA